MAPATRPLRCVLGCLVTLATAGAAVPASAAGGVGTPGGNAVVRVEVIDHDAGTRTRSTRAVAWSQTATMNVALAGHHHDLSITPYTAASGVSVEFNHARDGEVLADDLHLEGRDRRFVIDDAHTTVVVTIVAVKTTVAAE
jgi:hypothetical protein